MLSLIHNQTKYPPTPQDVLSSRHWVSGEGVMEPPETLLCSESPGPGGETPKGAGGGRPETLRNQHHGCSWGVRAPGRYPEGSQVLPKFSFLVVKAVSNYTHKPDKWVMAIWEGQASLCLVGKVSLSRQHDAPCLNGCNKSHNWWCFSKRLAYCAYLTWDILCWPDFKAANTWT